MSCDSSWSTFHTVNVPTGSGKVKSNFFESEVRRITLPSSKACGGRIRHSSTMVAGEKLGA